MSAIPTIPLRTLKGRLPVATQRSNTCAGCAAYGVRATIYLVFSGPRLLHLGSSCSWFPYFFRLSCWSRRLGPVIAGQGGRMA